MDKHTRMMKACITYSWSVELNQKHKKMHRSVYNICQTLIARWFKNHRQKMMKFNIYPSESPGRSHDFNIHSLTCSCRSDADSKSCRFSDLSWCDSRLPFYYLHCEARVISRSKKLSCLFCSTRGTDNIQPMCLFSPGCLYKIWDSKCGSGSSWGQFALQWLCLCMHVL